MEDDPAKVSCLLLVFTRPPVYIYPLTRSLSCFVGLHTQIDPRWCVGMTAAQIEKTEAEEETEENVGGQQAEGEGDDEDAEQSIRSTESKATPVATPAVIRCMLCGVSHPNPKLAHVYRSCTRCILLR